MDIHQEIQVSTDGQTIHTVDMHTSGEPTRIIIKGFPELHGTLLEQRTEVGEKYDYLRKRLMWEPRGHRDMYGAIIIQDTELVRTGEADIGVLFTHHEGLSTMCGHGTIALGRFLVDTHDVSVFPNRKRLTWDEKKRMATLKLHAPCGIVQVSVPTSSDGARADPARPVEFISVPCFATVIEHPLHIGAGQRWPQLRSDKTHVAVSLSYGGAFYAIVNAKDIGFQNGLRDINIEALTTIASILKELVLISNHFADRIKHPKEPDLDFLYGIIIEDLTLGTPQSGTAGANTAICIFADGQVDRSPCGSGVCARMAVKACKNSAESIKPWTYHSPVSVRHGSDHAFRASVFQDLENRETWISALHPDGMEKPPQMVLVSVAGRAHYTGSSTFIVEDGDWISEGGFCM